MKDIREHLIYTLNTGT